MYCIKLLLGIALVIRCLNLCSLHYTYGKLKFEKSILTIENGKYNLMVEV